MLMNVIQIGANIGRDHVFERVADRPDYRVLLVEPLPQAFDELKKTYALAKCKAIFEQSAITDRDCGEVSLYHLPEARLREDVHASEISSLG